jgi:branched-chain amino acid transport system substrate-binding protein
MSHRKTVSRILCAAVTLAAVVGLAGCSSEVKVGAIVTETGPASAYGMPVRKGLDLALEQINADGGFNGKPLVLVYRDDKTLPEVGEEVARELIEVEGVQFIVGPVSSPVTLAVAPIANENEVIVISPTASADAVTAAGDYVYRVYPSDILEATTMADFARDLGVEQMVVFSYDNSWGAGLLEVFGQKFTSKFRQIVQTYQIQPGDTSQFEAWAAEVADMKPDGVYIAAYAEDFGSLVRTLRDAGVEALLMGTSAFKPEVVDIAGDAAENLLFAQPSFLPAADYAPARAFAEAYRAKYGEDPERYAAYGYDALRVLHQAMLEVGATNVGNVRIGLSTLDNFEGATGRLAFDSHGDIVRYPQTFIVRDGVPVPWETFIADGGALPLPSRN